MRALVTGGLGFIGSHLVDALVERGDEVAVWDIEDAKGHPNRNDKAWYVRKDISQDCEYGPPPVDAVFHLAAISRIGPSFQVPVRTHDVNVTGTVNMLEIARRYSAKFVFAGTSCCDGDPYENPYAFSKHIGEEYCGLYRRLHGMPIASARFYNVYGPRQVTSGPFSTVVGIFERQHRMGEPLTIVGDGEQRRDFIHVHDIVDGILAMYDRDADGVFRLGTGKSYSINQLAAMFRPKSVEFLPSRRGEMHATRADFSSARKLLGWEPTRNLEGYIEEACRCGA